MSINTNNLQAGRLQLKNIPLPGEQNIDTCAEQLLDVVNHFPDLLKDKDEAKNLETVAQRIYCRKDLLPKEKQKEISKLFYSLHHLNPHRFEKLLEEKISVKNWALTHPEILAIVDGKQKYPIPSHLLKNEEMLCNQFFSSMNIQLMDGNVEISHGLLAHFSEKVRNTKETALRLDHLNRHQFDTLVGFLETEKMELLHEKNVLPLLDAAEYLEIPILVNACKQWIIQNSKALDYKTIVPLMNRLGPNDKCSNVLSHEISKLLQNFPKEEIEYLKTHLKCPLTLSFSKKEIGNKDLLQLQGLPIEKFQLIQCKKLTKECLPIIGTFNSEISLSLGGNDWVNDEALALIPQNVVELSLTGCRQFSGKGLSALKKSNVIRFELMFCKHLEDKDFAELPFHFQGLDLGSCKGIGKKTMKSISQMKQLVDLNLSFIKGVDVFSLPLQLHSLKLSQIPNSTEECKYLGKMGQLQSLTLANAQFNDEGLAAFPNSVSYLSLTDCSGITDKGIISLAERKGLILELFRCYQISYEATEKVKGALDLRAEKTPISYFITKAS